MNKEDYINIVNQKLTGIPNKLMLEQIENYYKAKNYQLPTNKYKMGDKIALKKGTLLHGTYKNLDGLKEITKDGLISSWFIDGRLSKYPSSIGVWNIKNDCNLSDYVNYYSGGTIKFTGLLENNVYTNNNKTAIIPFVELKNLNRIIIDNPCRYWQMEQTKETRFMPSLSADQVQIGIIFNSDNEYTKNLLNKDILNPEYINDIDVKPFVNVDYYDNFIIARKNKDDFFTNRESAILFGLPANLIEGIIVGRKYENNKDILREIKALLPNCYICSLDGLVIF